VRTRFSDNIDGLAADLAAMCGHAETAIADATRALLAADLRAAEQVISTREWFDDAARGWENKAFALIALQAPVAVDLRTLVGGLHISADLQRMGGLAIHICELTRRRHPTYVLPVEVREIFTNMGRLAAAHTAEAGDVLRNRDVERARRLEHTDEEMDDLNRTLLAHTTSGHWPHGVQAAIDVTLLGRFYERFSDHTVEIGRQVVFMETGERDTT
jgi:phosphate transport system protein